jgi:3-polyprenyl-4-hydroxybenzoate decarboxylase
MKRIIVAIAGASGAIYGVRALAARSGVVRLGNASGWAKHASE